MLGRPVDLRRYPTQSSRAVTWFFSSQARNSSGFTKKTDFGGLVVMRERLARVTFVRSLPARAQACSGLISAHWEKMTKPAESLEVPQTDAQASSDSAGGQATTTRAVVVI